MNFDTREKILWSRKPLFLLERGDSKTSNVE